MAELAYLSDELDLTDEEQAKVETLTRCAGTVPVEKLLAALREKGARDEDLLEAALALPLDEYQQVKDLYDSLPKPVVRHPRIRRRR